MLGQALCISGEQNFQKLLDADLLHHDHLIMLAETAASFRKTFLPGALAWSGPPLRCPDHHGLADFCASAISERAKDCPGEFSSTKALLLSHQGLTHHDRPMS